MNNDDGSFFVGLVIGIVAALTAGVIVIGINNDSWRTEAIANGCAQYNPETAVFEWRKK